jgi:hypothetical protein
MHPSALSAASLLVLAAAGFSPVPTAGDPCSGLDVRITDASHDERTLVCHGVRQALHLLGRCAVEQKRAIDVRILPEVRHPLAGPIFGFYDLKESYIAIAAYPNIIPLMRDTPYQGLSRRAFYTSLVVHEVVHSIMHQNQPRPIASQAMYEAPAYALQIMSLSPRARAQFLAKFDSSRLNQSKRLSDLILMFDPYFFAARAYHNFRTSTDVCADLTAAVNGGPEPAAQR